MKRKVIFACGGSAGHINPALAAAGALRKLYNNTEILFVGTGRELERKLIAGADFKLEEVKSTGFTRSISPNGILRNLRAFKLNRAAARRCDELIRALKPDVVVGTGGYGCYYMLIAAAKRGVPSVLHASDAVPGLAARRLMKHITRVYTPFPESVAYYKGANDVRVSPTPVRGEFAAYTRSAARSELGIGNEERLVVSFFGSQGAEGLNTTVRQLIEINSEKKAFRHIHAVGGGEQRLNAFIMGLKQNEGTDVRLYIDDMPRVMAAADLIICRAGASTLAELACVGRASILIPSPYVPNDHQTKNAEAMEKSNAALMMKESETDAAKLFAQICLLLDGDRIPEMEREVSKFGSRDSADRFALELLSVIN